ncbi:MAG: hypothetical protein ABR567_12020 [Myxococcales bacterium]|nr:hypothetical protein [Myxococcales bacterium]
MRVLAAAAAGIAASLLVRQPPEGRRPPRGRPDAGPVLLGTDPPGKLRPSPPFDAGTSAQADAGVDAVHAEILQLRARVDALERERAQLQQQSQQLSEIARQLQDLRSQLADADSRRQAAEQQQAARREQLQVGVSALYQAQSMLAGGNSSIDDQLAQAQGSFPPQAQRDIDSARTALQNRDLAAARAYLSAAISDAQQGK